MRALIRLHHWYSAAVWNRTLRGHVFPSTTAVTTNNSNSYYYYYYYYCYDAALFHVYLYPHIHNIIIYNAVLF